MSDEHGRFVLDLSRNRWPIQIDPPGCGCNECGSGEYVPLGVATALQVTDMLAGRLGNATGWENDQFLVIATGTGRIVRIIYPTRNDDLLDAVTREGMRIR
jgi:hypothetical protein